MPLTDFTFWAGAGFSKSWDPDAPDGNELFTFDASKLEGLTDLDGFSRLFGLKDDDIKKLDDVRQIVYQLDMYERYSDVCSRYMDPQNINVFRAALRAAVVRGYDKFARLNYFDSQAQKFPLASSSSQQKSILSLFAYIHRCVDGSEYFSEGIRCHFATTNYDYVIETILDNILAPDDSLFLYTYRGFTPSRISEFRNPVLTHQHGLTKHLIKLNGGFEILRENDRYVLDYSNRSQEQITNKPPIIMLPSREQDYSDPYFRTIFPKVVRLMRDTKVLVLVGYSLPPDDALMRFILRQFAEEPEDARHKVILYIDRVVDAAKLKRLQTVFPSIDEWNAPRLATYEGSFADFAAECVSLIKGWDEQIEV